MELKLSRNFTKSMANKVGKYEFEVGVLGTVAHKEPKSNKEPAGSYAGGPVRRKSSEGSEGTAGDILVKNMKRLNTNLLSEPFEKKNSDIIRFMKGFFNLVAKRGMSEKRLENLLQAVVRNPILKKKYGQNTSTTADNKGFDRHLIDTGQMFKAIKAKVKRVSR